MYDMTYRMDKFLQVTIFLAIATSVVYATTSERRAYVVQRSVTDGKPAVVVEKRQRNTEQRQYVDPSVASTEENAIRSGRQDIQSPHGKTRVHTMVEPMQKQSHDLKSVNVDPSKLYEHHVPYEERRSTGIENLKAGVKESSLRDLVDTNFRQNEEFGKHQPSHEEQSNDVTSVATWATAKAKDTLYKMDDLSIHSGTSEKNTTVNSKSLTPALQEININDENSDLNTKGTNVIEETPVTSVSSAVGKSGKFDLRLETSGSNTESADQRGTADVTAATDGQLREMCQNNRCYNSVEAKSIAVPNLFATLPHMLRYLQRKQCKIVGATLMLLDHSPKLERIVATGTGESRSFELQFEGNKRIKLMDTHRQLITENMVKFSLPYMHKLQQIDDGFFEYFFPNIKKLIIGTDTSPQFALPELHIGYLPMLDRLEVKYPVNGDIVGCLLPTGEEACFAENIFMTFHDSSYPHPLQLRLVDFNLPQKVLGVEINFKKAIFKETKVFEDKDVYQMRITVKSTNQLSGLRLDGTVIGDYISITGGSASESSDFPKHFDGILHNRMVAESFIWWSWEGSEWLRMPVAFGSKLNQPLENADVKELEKAKCKLASDISKQANEDSLEMISKKKFPRVLIMRGLFVDVTEVIDRLKREKISFDELEVFAFHAHISASRNVRYPIRVFYIKITSDNNAAIFRYFRRKNGYISIRHFVGGQLEYASTVDAVFVQAMKICTSINNAQDRNLGTVSSTENSIGNQMWSYKLPSNLTGTSEQISKAQQMILKTGEFMEYWQEASLNKAMRVPYLSLEYHEENLKILLHMAESIVLEKQHNKLMSSLDGVKTEVLDNQDRSTVALLQTEYKRTVSLVLISTRRAHDIENKLNSTIDLVQDVSATFEEHRQEMESENVTFMEGVRRAKAFAYAEIAAAVTSSIFSFFTGGFDSGKVARAAKKVKDLAIKLRKVMKLSVIFKKLAKLINTLRNIQKLSRQASKSLSGRVGRLFTTIKNFKVKRDSHLTRLLKESKAFPIRIPLLLKKQHENKQQIAKYTKMLDNAKKVRKTADYLKGIMESIVEAQQAQIALDNAFEEEPVQDIEDLKLQKVGNKDIAKALVNEFAIAAGDRQSQLNEFSRILKDYELTESKKVVEEGEKLNAADVLEWDAANANIEANMDASLSMDIPETAGFKAALVQMNLAGKLRTQAMIDEAALRVDLDRARFETTTYFKEGAAILKQIKDIENGIKMRKSGKESISSPEYKKRYNRKIEQELLRRDWREFSVKFNILIASQSYCSAYIYYHLSPCPPDHVFDFDTKMADIIYQQRELQRQSILQLEDFYPPPQTMVNRSMTFTRYNTTCLCITGSMMIAQRIGYKNLYKYWLHCLKDKGSINAEKKKYLHQLYQDCELNKVMEMRKSKRFSVEVNLSDEPDRSRVRVDEIQVVLHGAQTNDGVIKMTIESSGLSQDRFKNEIFDFYGDKWQREYAYYSPQNSKAANPHRLVEEVHVLDAADVYQRFLGVFRTSTLFTTWTIKVDPKQNSGLDLSELHRIDLKFTGSFVGAKGYQENPTNSDDAT